MITYAIRHKPTGKFMPCRMTRCGFGGWSWWTPTGKDQPFDTNPRIFYTPQSARNALTMWLQGAWRLDERTESESWELPSTYTVRELVPDEPPAPRSRDDMEIVTFDLTERTS